MKASTSFVSDISKKEFPVADRIAAKAIRNPILALIQNEYPDFDEDKFIAISELNRFRERYISNYLVVEIGELSNFEAKVIGSLNEDKCLVNTVEDEIGV